MRSPQSILSLLVWLLYAQLSFAELKELEDEKLKELHGKEGITIDLSYKLSIGEIMVDFRDRELTKDERQRSIAPPPPRIEYHQNGN